jgi:hypothetical protein
MLRPPSLLGQTSGFVPFSSGGSVHGDLDETATSATPSTLRVAPPAPAVAAVAPASVDGEATPWRQATWTPAATGRVRFVEGAVLAAVCGYFSLGLIKLAGWL